MLNVDGVMKRDTVDYLWWLRIMDDRRKKGVLYQYLRWKGKNTANIKYFWRERIGKLSWRTHLRDMFDNTNFNDVKKQFDPLDLNI